jgi:hypothetical protein
MLEDNTELPLLLPELELEPPPLELLPAPLFPLPPPQAASKLARMMTRSP